jgi:hypothetical protein
MLRMNQYGRMSQSDRASCRAEAVHAGSRSRRPSQTSTFRRREADRPLKYFRPRSIGRSDQGKPKRCDFACSVRWRPAWSQTSALLSLITFETVSGVCGFMSLPIDRLYLAEKWGSSHTKLWVAISCCRAWLANRCPHGIEAGRFYTVPFIILAKVSIPRIDRAALLR